MRRWMIFAIAGALAAAGAFWRIRPVASEVNRAEEIAPGVFFHEGDLQGKGHCNNGWVVFDDYVLVVDANFPSGALEVIPKIRAVSDRPIRFAFDTHHHGDHAYGNQVWVEHGAVPVAHTGVLEEMKRYETGYYGGQPGRWEDAAKSRPDVAASRLKPPTLLFPDEMIFDDGKKRVELRFFGVAHTHGDGWAWMPKERILFSGDACVNGPYNYVGDGSVKDWIRTLEQAQKLNPRIVVPGHGPVAEGSLLEDQKQYFLALRRQVRRLVERGRTPAQVQAAVPRIREELTKRERIRRYVGDFLEAQVQKVYSEMGGGAFPRTEAARAAEEHHALDHHLPLLSGSGGNGRRPAAHERAMRASR